MNALYRWLDYWSGQYRKVRCEILSSNGKTTTIRLKGYGPNNRPPESVMRVRPSSVITDQKKEPDTSWHEWTD